MESITATEAKTHFGDLLIKAQNEPVQIERNGKPLAVMISCEDYSTLETLKIEYLKNRIEAGMKDIKAGNLIDGEEFFQDLLAGKFD